jgi:hypothetical protein
MTDISRWPELVQVVKLRQARPIGGKGWQPGPEGEPIFSEYALLPFNEYTLGHLLGMLARIPDNGDWHDEMISMCCAAMNNWGLAEVTNNWGDTFAFDEVVTRRFLAKVRPYVCRDCGKDVTAEKRDSYEVHGALWKEHGADKGFLCLACFEKRLGRAVTKQDLTDRPVNHRHPVWLGEPG